MLAYGMATYLWAAAHTCVRAFLDFLLEFAIVIQKPYGKIEGLGAGSACQRNVAETLPKDMRSASRGPHTLVREYEKSFSYSRCFRREPFPILFVRRAPIQTRLRLYHKKPFASLFYDFILCL